MQERDSLIGNTYLPPVYEKLPFFRDFYHMSLRQHIKKICFSACPYSAEREAIATS